ncbi:MAG: lysylphosphatidylglycerol synthase transmembrane domain-containing protein [Spirochaetota bacterium]
MEKRNKSGNPEAVKTRKKSEILTIRSFVMLAFSIALAVFLFHQINITETLRAFSSADLVPVTAACCIYFISNYFKSIRYNAILKKYSIGAFNIFAITAYQNFFNQLLPARAGELTLIYYMKKIAGADVSSGFHVLLVTRIYDFIVVAAFFIISLVIYSGHNMPYFLMIGTGLFVVSIIFLFSIKRIVHIAQALYNRAIVRFGLLEKPAAMKLKSGLEKLDTEFSDYDIARQAPVLVLTSIFVWITQYLLAYLVIISFGVNLGIAQSVAGSTGQVIANVLPVNSFGSFGTLEAGWTGGYVLAGMSAQDAITTGLAYHFITLAAAIMLAFVCYGSRKIIESRRSALTFRS